MAALASVRAGCVELIAGQFQNQGHLSVGFIFRISEVKMQADFGSAQNIQHLHGFLQVQNCWRLAGVDSLVLVRRKIDRSKTTGSTQSC